MVRPGLAAALASGNVTSARVISVNVGRGKDADWAGKLGRTAIDKRPVAGQAELGRLGLRGDEQVDKPAHGGPEQAVYAYAREDLDWWVEQLGREMTNGMFGENITTMGVDVTRALIGEIWQMGAATVQVTGPRIPCVVFAGRMDEPQWVKRFADARRPGAYLRVLREGVVAAGDPVEVVARPDERVTIAESMTAYYGDAELMSRLLRVEGRGLAWDQIAPGVLERAAPRS
jgi:MOSC domain-containing protein YiiM